MKYAVVDIGCIECGESSSLVGIFTNESRADEIAHTLQEKMGWQGGQHKFQVFPLDTDNEIHPDYVEALK